MVYAVSGRRKEAESATARGLEMLEKLVGKEHPLLSDPSQSRAGCGPGSV